jgi:hypothetical protein
VHSWLGLDVAQRVDAVMRELQVAHHRR